MDEVRLTLDLINDVLAPPLKTQIALVFFAESVSVPDMVTMTFMVPSPGIRGVLVWKACRR